MASLGWTVRPEDSRRGRRAGRRVGARATVRAMPEQSQIGVTGLAVMGAQPGPQHRPPRHPDRRAQPHRGARPSEFIERVRRRGRRSPARESLEEFVAALERPRRIIVMVKAGAPVDARDRRARAAARRGRHRHRRAATRTSPTPARRDRGAAPSTGLRFVGIGVSGGEEGALHGPEHHARRRRARPTARSRRSSPRSPRRSTARRAARYVGAGRRRPLREDGPQRHRVRRHAADRRGLRPAAPRRRARRRRRSPTIFDEWNAGDLESFLIEITADGARARRTRRPASRWST